MPSFTKKYFSPPIFPGDEEKTRQARLLNALNLLGLGYLGLITIVQFLGGSPPLHFVLTNLVFLGVTLFIRFQLGRGQVSLVGYETTITAFIWVTSMGVEWGVIHTPAAAMYLFVVILAGMLFERNGLLVSITTCSLAVLGLILAEDAGKLYPSIYKGSFIQWITYTFLFGMIGSLSYFSNRAIRRSLEQAGREIAERKRVEMELRKLTPGVEQSPASIVITDLNWNIEYVNPRFTQISGYSLEEVLGKNPGLLKAGLTPPETYTQLRDALAAGKEWRGEFANRKKDGTVYYEATVITPVTDENGTVTHYLAVKEDITVMRRMRLTTLMQRDLAQTLAGISSIQEALGLCLERTLEAASLDCGGIYLVDRTTRDLDLLVSQGLSPDFIQNGRHIPVGSPRWKIVMEGKAIYTIYDQIRTQNSPGVISEGLRALGLVPLLYQNQVIGCFNLASHTQDDISSADRYLIEEIALQITNALVRIIAQEDLQRSHDELRRSEARFQALFEQTHDAIFLVNLDGSFLAANQRAADMLGYTLDEFKDLSIRDISAEIDQSNQVSARLFSGEHIPLFERKFRRKNGKTFPAETHLELVRDSNGAPLHIQSVVRDISERKQAEADLKAAHDELEKRVQERTAELKSTNQALEKALSARDEFMAAMSHELRTPLNGILGFAEALQLTLYGGLTAKQLKSVQHIEASGRRLLTQINAVLDYTQLQSGKLYLEPKPCSLASICQDSLQALEGKASAKGQRIEFSVSPQTIRLIVDERRIQQIVTCLLDNAIKFTPEDGCIELKVTGLPDERQVKICIADNGIGIKEEDLPRLFQPFVQLDARLSRMYSGAGLSLALAKSLVELHGGGITVDSTFDQGSCFSVTLPWQDQ